MHRKLSALLLLAHCCHSCLALLQPAVRVRRARPMSSLDASKSAATIADYDAVAAAFDAGNKDHDVSQNIDALLGAIACLLYTSPSPRDGLLSRMPSSA